MGEFQHLFLFVNQLAVPLNTIHYLKGMLIYQRLLVFDGIVIRRNPLCAKGFKVFSNLGHFSIFPFILSP
jgi:hypothetical protein